MHSLSSLSLPKVTALAFCLKSTPEIVRHLSLPLNQRELTMLRPAGLLEVLCFVLVLVLPKLFVTFFLTDVLSLNNLKRCRTVTEKFRSTVRIIILIA